MWFWRLRWWHYGVVAVVATSAGVALWLNARGSPSGHYKGNPTGSDLNWYVGTLCFLVAATATWIAIGRKKGRL